MKLIVTFEVELQGETTVAEALTLLRLGREVYVQAVRPLGRVRCSSVQPAKKHGAHR